MKEKDDALHLLEIARKDYLLEARKIAVRIYLRSKKPITVDHVRRECPPPEEVDPRVMGAIFNTENWEKVGYILSGRRTCHGRPIALFKMVA